MGGKDSNRNNVMVKSVARTLDKLEVRRARSLLEVQCACTIVQLIQHHKLMKGTEKMGLGGTRYLCNLERHEAQQLCHSVNVECTDAETVP